MAFLRMTDIDLGGPRAEGQGPHDKSMQGHGIELIAFRLHQISFQYESHGHGQPSQGMPQGNRTTINI